MDSPFCARPISTMAYQAVKNATGTPAASSNERASGFLATASSRVTISLAKQAGAKASTASPCLNLVTLEPTSVTMPAASKPIVGPEKPFSSASSGRSPIAHITSRKLSAVARTDTRTSSSAKGLAGTRFQYKRSNFPGTSKASSIGFSGFAAA